MFLLDIRVVHFIK